MPNSSIQPSDDQLFAELRKIDTPTITNVVATYPKNPLCLGLYNPWTENWYTDTSIRCIYPEMGAIVGYAVTCVYGLPDPNYCRPALLHGRGRCARRHEEADHPGDPAEVAARAA